MLYLLQYLGQIVILNINSLSDYSAQDKRHSVVNAKLNIQINFKISILLFKFRKVTVLINDIINKLQFRLLLISNLRVDRSN